jgi:hypothetical protein
MKSFGFIRILLGVIVGGLLGVGIYYIFFAFLYSDLGIFLLGGKSFPFFVRILFWIPEILLWASAGMGMIFGGVIGARGQSSRWVSYVFIALVVLAIFVIVIYKVIVPRYFF